MWRAHRGGGGGARAPSLTAAASPRGAAARRARFSSLPSPPPRLRPFLQLGDHPEAAAPLFAAENTLARIDPATNRVSAVIDVGQAPAASAVGGHSVWVYNRDDSTISEIDAEDEPCAEDDAGHRFTRRVLWQPHGAGAGRRCVRRVVHQRRSPRQGSAHASTGRCARETRVPARPHAHGGRGREDGRLGRRPRRERLPGAPHRSVHGPCDRTDALRRLVRDRFDRRRLRACVGRRFSRRDALPDRPAHGQTSRACRARESSGHAAAADELRRETSSTSRTRPSGGLGPRWTPRR